MRVNIVGASGYVGGELLRLLLKHPEIEIDSVTSERFSGKPVSSVHPNLRKQTDLKFCGVEDLDKVDLLFLALPHGELMNNFDDFNVLSEKIIDLSADFRLDSDEIYQEYYGAPHPAPEWLNKAQYVYLNYMICLGKSLP